MSEQPTVPVPFHGPGIEALLVAGRDGQCLMRLVQTQSGPADGILEVLKQPVDESGFPQGFNALLWEGTVEFCGSGAGTREAYVWLPSGLSFDVARNCYYRIRPV